MLITDSVTMEDIKKIHNGSFVIPEKYYIKRSIIDNGVLVAAGLVKLTCEGILVIDESLPLVTKTKAIGSLIGVLSDSAKKFGLDDCHVFAKNNKMQEFLKHIGFQDCKGKAMVLFL